MTDDPLRNLIRTIPDFPKPGIQFRDITTVLRDAEGDLGFYELDRRSWPVINLAYFGLYPRAMGLGIGMALLQRHFEFFDKQTFATDFAERAVEDLIALGGHAQDVHLMSHATQQVLHVVGLPN